MACTTILVGKDASYNGSTMIARNDDSPSGKFTAKRWTVVKAEEQPQVYKSIISHCEIMLPADPMGYTSMPNADITKEGIWAACGVNEAQVAMTATETISSNERVLAADPLVEYHPAEGSCPEQIGGIGEEDIVVITLPYIRSAREGVLRLGSLLEEYGTYEMNGIAFQDLDEIWWLETIGGHHWMARRVPDDAYVTMPNQLGIDEFDFVDALGEEGSQTAGEQKNFMCSSDLRDFVKENHLDLTLEGEFNPREAFGSHDDADHVYNTPRAWYMQRYLNPNSNIWDGRDADYRPESDDIPWCRVAERKITSEDVKYLLSSHYQGTPYDPYATYGDHTQNGAYRSIGINRNDFMALIEMRPDLPEECRVIEWIAYASNAFNTMVPFYANVTDTPEYLKNTTLTVSTDNFYWASRLIAALTDAGYKKNIFHIEHYQQAVVSKGRAIIKKFDAEIKKSIEEGKSEKDRMNLRMAANKEIAIMLQKETDDTLTHVLYEASNVMRNQYSRSDH